ncbi:MAG: TIGR04282 family arsenosugar biosynthesis glycosyltransferase [Phormidesmis sp.]
MLNDSSDGLFLFTRFPQPGQAKTRLIPTLGEAGAASLQKQMTEHLLRRFQPICAKEDIQLQIHFAGGSRQEIQSWLGQHVLSFPQCEGSLGDRIAFALQQGFAAQLQRIIVVGSDCPGIDKTHILQALALLETHDVVLGPATDGGYYLIGLNQLWLPLFENVPWSTERLLAMTRAIAARMGLSVALLKPLSDIDRPEDLPIWYRVLEADAA